MRRRGLGHSRSRLLIMGALPVGLLAAGFAGVRAWYPSHVERVTGRSGMPEVSCSYCHMGKAPPPVRGAAAGPGYPSPEGMAISPDGSRLYVAASGLDQLLEVDLVAGRVLRAVSVPGRPHGVAITDDGRRLAVSCRDADQVVLLDTGSLIALGSLPAGPEPLGLAFSHDGKRLHVAGGLSDDLLIADLDFPSRNVRLVAGNEPYALSLSRDGSLLAAANRLARPVTAGVVPASEVTLVDPVRERIHERRVLESAHLSEGVAVSSDGSFALATAIRVRNLLPLTQVSHGAVMNSTIVFIETRSGGRAIQFPLATVNSFFADPSGIALTPDDRVAFVAHTGADTITAVDVAALRDIVAGGSTDSLNSLADDLTISSRYILTRIPTREAPRSLAMSPGGDLLYAAESLADSVAVIDVKRMQVSGRIELGAPRKLTAERRGERVFFNASGTFQGQFSCRSCHPDGHQDGLAYDFEPDGLGRNLVDNRSLLGIHGTEPFKWIGLNPDVKTQCGPRFAMVLTRADPFPAETLENLVAFLESLPPRRPGPASSGGAVSGAAERGRALFLRSETNDGRAIPEEDRCVTCHPPPTYTNRRLTDVGTKAETDDFAAFDVPHLRGVGRTAPYLHDGRAPTLESIWTLHDPEGRHGVVTDLTKIQLNDFVEFLRGL